MFYWSVFTYNSYMTFCIKVSNTKCFVYVFITVLTRISSVLNSSICLLLLNLCNSPTCVGLLVNVLCCVTSLGTP